MKIILKAMCGYHWSSMALPQAHVCIWQTAICAVQTRREGGVGLQLTSLRFLRQTKGSQGGGRKRRGGSKGRGGRHARGLLPVIVQARSLAVPWLLIVGWWGVRVLRAIPCIKSACREGIPTGDASVGWKRNFFLPWGAISYVSVIYLQRKNNRRFKIIILMKNLIKIWLLMTDYEELSKRVKIVMIITKCVYFFDASQIEENQRSNRHTWSTSMALA